MTEIIQVKAEEGQIEQVYKYLESGLTDGWTVLRKGYP